MANTSATFVGSPSSVPTRRLQYFLPIYSTICDYSKRSEQIFLKFLCGLGLTKGRNNDHIFRSKSFSGVQKVPNFERSDFKYVFSVTLAFCFLLLRSNECFYVVRAWTEEEVITYFGKEQDHTYSRCKKKAHSFGNAPWRRAALYKCFLVSVCCRSASARVSASISG